MNTLNEAARDGSTLNSLKQQSQCHRGLQSARSSLDTLPMEDNHVSQRSRYDQDTRSESSAETLRTDTPTGAGVGRKVTFGESTDLDASSRRATHAVLQRLIRLQGSGEEASTSSPFADGIAPNADSCEGEEGIISRLPKLVTLRVRERLRERDGFEGQTDMVYCLLLN